MSVATARIYAPTDLSSLPNGQSCELIDGELVEKNTGFLSSYVEGTVLTKLSLHYDRSELGKVFTVSMGYQCFPWARNNVRKADVSFIRQERLTAKLWELENLSIAPDLAVEVLAPNDVAHVMDLRIKDYLRAGVALIWVIDPQDHVVMVYRTVRRPACRTATNSPARTSCRVSVAASMNFSQSLQDKRLASRVL